MLEQLGRTLLWIGGGVLLLGGMLWLAGHLGLGRLPGDILFRREGLTVYIPLGLMILLSILLTIVLNVLLRIRR